MNKEVSLNSIMEAIVQDYYKTFGYEEIPFKISIVEDMGKEYAKIRPDLVENCSENIKSLNNNNGTMVPCYNDKKEFVILINKAYFMKSLEKDCSWIGTIIHEATHINDYCAYSKLTHINNFKEIMETHLMFNMWSEFHAKANGYYFVRKYTFEDICDERQIDDIINTELPFQMRYMGEEYSKTNDANIQMYVIAHFLGRLYVWEKLFPYIFTEDYIQKLLGANEWMLSWYQFLKKNDTIELAYKKLETMKNILSNNFCGLEMYK